MTPQHTLPVAIGGKTTMTTLAEAVAEILLYFYADKQLPTRRAIVARMKAEYQHLDHPKIDLEVGQSLNRLVDWKILRRVKGPSGQHYAPG